MALPQNILDAVILKTQIINDLKTGVAAGMNLPFDQAVAELTRVGYAALKKYVAS